MPFVMTINVSSPGTHQQLDELGVRMMDMGTNTSDIEVGPHRDGARIVTLDANTQASLLIVDVMIPSGGGRSSSNTPNKFIYIGVWTEFIKTFSGRNFCYEGPKKFQYYHN